jgi:hypothetical protein
METKESNDGDDFDDVVNDLLVSQNPTKFLIDKLYDKHSEQIHTTTTYKV